jgi:16S rRNA (guanine527-N7)-methyltransferase
VPSSESLGQILASGAAEIGVAVSPAQVHLLERHAALITMWNRRLRLTGARTAEDVARILILGALEILRFLPSAGSVLDLGSGAGIPGIPMAVMRAGVWIVLVEASRRKAAFLELAVRDLGLANVAVLNARAEEVGRDPDHRERYDAVTARALAPLRVLVEYALPLLRVGGVAVFPKGAGAADEVAAAADVLRILGGRAETEPPSRPQGSPVVVIRKTAPTPPEFPRRPGIPVRRPV